MDIQSYSISNNINIFRETIFRTQYFKASVALELRRWIDLSLLAICQRSTHGDVLLDPSRPLNVVSESRQRGQPPMLLSAPSWRNQEPVERCFALLGADAHPSYQGSCSIKPPFDVRSECPHSQSYLATKSDMLHHLNHFSF